MTSKPAASQAHSASRVRRATPPRAPPAGDGRVKAAGARASSAMRVLSPRIAPPPRRDDGSTASTARRRPAPLQSRPKGSMKVDLPTPGARGGPQPPRPRPGRPAPAGGPRVCSRRSDGAGAGDGHGRQPSRGRVKVKPARSGGAGTSLQIPPELLDREAGLPNDRSNGAGLEVSAAVVGDGHGPS